MSIARAILSGIVGTVLLAHGLATTGCGSEDAGAGLLVFPLPDDPLDPSHPWPASRQIDPATEGMQLPRGVLEEKLDPGPDGDRARDFFSKLRLALADTDGAGVTATVHARPQGDIDPASLADHVHVLDARGQPTKSEARVVDGAIEIDPVTPWDSGTTYVVVVTGVRDRAGRRCEASAGVRTLLETDPAPRTWFQEQTVVRKALEEAKIPRQEVCLAFSFRTLRLENQLRDLYQGVLARAAFASTPRYAFTETRAPHDVKGLETSTHVKEVLYGTFRSFDLRDEHGRIGRHRLLETELAPNDLRFALSIPATGSPPYPVVMGLHGLGGSIDTTLPLYAELLGQAGFAYVTIDGVAHGSRSTGEAPQLAIVDIEDPRRSRDVFRQTLVDLLQLRTTIDLGISRDGAADLLERDHVRWTGGSYGGIFGTLMAAVDPGLEAAHVEACGGPWRDIVLRGNVGLAMIGVLLANRTGMVADMRDPAFATTLTRTMSVAQWILDAADPSALAEFIHRRPLDPARPPRVLMQYWLGETVMPNEASALLARALDVPVNQTAASSDGVRAVWDYDLARWGAPGGNEGHGAFWKIPQARQQALAFLQSHGTTIDPP